MISQTNTEIALCTTNNEPLQLHNIKNLYMNNTKVSNIISTKGITTTSGETPIRTNNKKDIITFVNLYNVPNVTLSQTITQFDMAIMDTVYTIMAHGYRTFTAEEIAKLFSGNMNQKVTPNKLHRIRESLEKLGTIRIKIDATDEMNSRITNKSTKLKPLVLDTNLLSLDIDEAEIEGIKKRFIKYVIKEMPALYKYAEALNQIIHIPISLFNTTEYFNDTDESVLIKRYVLKRVFQMKSQKNNLYSNKISLIWKDTKKNEIKGLYKELGYEPNSTNKWRQTTKPMITKAVIGTLEALKDNGIIQSYVPYREDGTNNPASPITGYEIKFPTAEKHTTR